MIIYFQKNKTVKCVDYEKANKKDSTSQRTSKLNLKQTEIKKLIGHSIPMHKQEAFENKARSLMPQLQHGLHAASF